MHAAQTTQTKPMSESMVVAFIAAIPPTLMALASLLKSQENGRKSDQIHVLVNSNLTNVKQELADANKRIVQLQKTVEALLPSDTEGPLQ